MKRRAAFRDELERWAAGPRAVREQVLERRRAADEQRYRGAMRVLVR